VTPQRRQALERIVLHATTLRIPIVEVEGGSLTALAGFDGHQGVAVVVEARRFASVDDILARAIERGEAAFVLALDSLEDPQNVGTLLRSAEAAGVHGVIFPTERQAPLSPAAVKASAGATEHLLLAPVDDLPGTLTDLHLRGLRIVGSDADASLSAREADMRGPIAIVVGSEGHGLAPAVRRRADLFVRIPMRGAIGSLNAAVAGSILVFEALGQRDPGARPEARPEPRTGRPRRAAATAGPPGTAGTADPAETTETTERAEPAEMAETAEIAETAESAETAQTVHSARTADGPETADTADGAQTADGQETAHTADGAHTADDDETAQSTDADESRPKQARKLRGVASTAGADAATETAEPAPTPTDVVAAPKPARRSRKVAAEPDAAGSVDAEPAPEETAAPPKRARRSGKAAAQPDAVPETDLDPSDDALLPEPPARPARRSSRARPA
jgi:23S rRNA (guanosine2251-2'-O)-methyltransferase